MGWSTETASFRRQKTSSRHIDAVEFWAFSVCGTAEDLKIFFRNRPENFRITEELGRSLLEDHPETYRFRFWNWQMLCLRHKGIHEFNVFQKPTSTGTLDIDGSSFHHLSHKIAAFHSIVHRLLLIPLSLAAFCKELDITGYPAKTNFVRLIIFNFVHTISRSIQSLKATC